jgi:hypothetical protein
MKTITLTGDNGEKYQVNIVYSIFDITNSLLQENFEVASADNAQQALKIYNKVIGRTCNYKRTDAYSIFQDASVCVSSQFFDKDGIRYKYGRRTWFKII